jgi:hypothetical protein
MSESENPYAAPEGLPPAGLAQAYPNDRSMFAQILAVGILQTVVGALELLIGGLLVVMAAMIPLSLQMSRRGPSPNEELSVWMVGLAYGGLGTAAVTSGCLRLISGISSFYFRRRTLMIVSLIFGLVTSLTCYCAVTATPLAIYGMIIMTSPAAKRAYAMRKAGMSPNDIRRHFSY